MSTSGKEALGLDQVPAPVLHHTDGHERGVGQDYVATHEADEIVTLVAPSVAVCVDQVAHLRGVSNVAAPRVEAHVHVPGPVPVRAPSRHAHWQAPDQ